jgi:hypothetical protein
MLSYFPQVHLSHIDFTILTILSASSNPNFWLIWTFLGPNILNTWNYCLKFEVLSDVTTKISAFWDKTLCIVVEIYQCFWSASGLHLQDRKRRQWSSELLFDFKDESNIFLRNIDKFVTDYTMSRPKVLLTLQSANLRKYGFAFPDF